MPGSVFDAVVTVFRLHKPDTKPFLDSEIYATATRDNKSGTWRLRLRHLVSDYTGTLSYRGKLVAGVEERLRRLDALVDIHVLTADTRGPLPSN